MMEHSVSDCPNPEGFREAIEGIVKRYWHQGIRLNEVTRKNFPWIIK